MIKDHCKPLNLGWLDAQLKKLYTINKHDFRHDFSVSQKEIPELVDVLILMMKGGRMFTRSIDVSEKMGISRRTARKYLLLLCKLRWCMRGKWVTYNDVNPFLQLLIYLFPEKMKKIVKTYSPKQVDLLDLFSFSLLEAVEQKVNDVSFIWSQHEPNFDGHYFPRQGYYARLYPYFNGTVQIKAETDNGDYHSILPYNIHWTGRNSHITLPIPFKFYGVQECGFSKNNELKVHFDNSITVGIPLGSASYTDRKLKQEWGQKHWSNMANSFMNKYWANQYVECFDFETHEEIIKNRLYYKAIPIKQAEEKTFLLKKFLSS